MRPEEIRHAIREGWPVVLPVGVLEYHGEHLPVGVDGLVVAEALARLEAEQDLVMLPAFWYGAASHAVAGPEGTGTVHVDAGVLAPFAEQVFTGLLRVGFRNVHVLIHHQTENFVAGMPTDLAFKLAARQAIFAFLEKQRGEGWWGRSDMAGYYGDHAAGRDPFNWIAVHPLLDQAAIARFPFDHAGEGETSLMLALKPETVDMDGVSGGPWYTESAARASAETGEQGVMLILGHLKSILRRAGASEGA